MAASDGLPATIAADIKAILTAPDVDLDSISAKKVRKALEERYPTLDTKAHKSAIDAVTVPLFHEVRAEREAAAKAAKAAAQPPKPPKASSSAAAGVAVPKRKRSVSADDVPSSSPFPLATNGKLKSGGKLTDEEIARRLHEEMNPGRPSRSGSSTKVRRPAGGASSGGSKKLKKSSAYVDDSDDDGATSSRLGLDSDDDGEGAGGVKKAKRKRKNADGGKSTGGYNKEMTCSPALAELIGSETSSRPQVVKKIWEHIKANDLQDPNDRRQILCDDAMRKVFNVDSVHMFTMNKLLGGHLYNVADVVA